MYLGVAGVLVILFLASVARFYHPGTGFTAFIAFPAGHDTEVPAMREVPHFDYVSAATTVSSTRRWRSIRCSRSGLRSRHGLPPYRARRMLFSWTA